MKRMNDNILKTTYVFTGLFVILAIYLIIYIFTDGREDINNTYNKRLELLEKKVVRGTIYSRDMKVLANTVIDDNDNETRIYPYDEMFCHVVGSYDMGSYGLESAYNFELLTSNHSIVDEIIADLNNNKLRGNNIITTLDVELQSACYKAMGNYEGSVVLMDAITGDILAMISKPDYNPNDISKIWNDINNDSNGVLLNRATQGLYPPGSVFKLFTLGEYIKTHTDNYEDYVYACTGSVKFDNFTINCSNKKAHGKLTLLNGFARSCNCMFVDLCLDIDVNSLQTYCNEKLFNTQLPIDISYKNSVFVLNVNDDEFMKCQTVIGQGETLVTPIHMCMVMSSIVNDGMLIKPRFISKIIDNNEKVVRQIESSEYMPLYTPNEASMLKDYLREVVSSGTATRLKTKDKDIYGKTGTAQINSTGKADSWFVGGIETKSGSKYSIAVVIENIDDNTAPSVAVTKEIINALD